MMLKMTMVQHGRIFSDKPLAASLLKPFMLPAFCFFLRLIFYAPYRSSRHHHQV